MASRLIRISVDVVSWTAAVRSASRVNMAACACAAVLRLRRATTSGDGGSARGFLSSLTPAGAQEPPEPLESRRTRRSSRARGTDLPPSRFCRHVRGGTLRPTRRRKSSSFIISFSSVLPSLVRISSGRSCPESHILTPQEGGG